VAVRQPWRLGAHGPLRAGGAFTPGHTVVYAVRCTSPAVVCPPSGVPGRPGRGSPCAPARSRRETCWWGYESKQEGFGELRLGEDQDTSWRGESRLLVTHNYNRSPVSGPAGRRTGSGVRSRPPAGQRGEGCERATAPGCGGAPAPSP